MKVTIDYELCMGDQNCCKVCPEVFRYDDEILASRVLMEDVPERLQARVKQAAEECAPGAIIVDES